MGGGLTAMQAIGHRMAKGAAWMVLFKLLERCLGLASTVVLARLLVPADFGIVALAMAVSGALEILTSFSFDLALIQNREADRQHYDTAWTFNILAGAFLAAAMAALGKPASAFFSEPRVEGIMYFLALCFFIQSFANIGTIAFQKELELHKEFRLGLAKKIVQVAVGVSLAFYFRNYWALLFGTLAARVSGVWLSYALHPYRPRFSLVAANDLFHFSKWMFLSNIIVFIASRGTDFVIGRLAGASALGLYTVAYEVSNLPTTELVYPMTKAIFPGYVKVIHDKERFRSMFLDVLRVTALVAMPIGLLIVVFAKPVVLILLGQKWIDAVPLVQVLAIYGIIRALQAGTGAVYLASGRPTYVALINGIIACVAIPLSVVALLTYGFTAVPYAMVCGGIISAVVNFTLCARLLTLRWSELIRVTLRAVGGGCVLVVVGIALSRLPMPRDAGWVWASSQVALIGVTTIAYCVAIAALWWRAGCPEGPDAMLFRIVRQWGRRRADP